MSCNLCKCYLTAEGANTTLVGGKRPCGVAVKVCKGEHAFTASLASYLTCMINAKLLPAEEDYVKCSHANSSVLIEPVSCKHRYVHSGLMHCYANRHEKQSSRSAS